MQPCCMVHTIRWMCCFFSETKVESHPRFDAARAHLPRDVAEVPVHHASCKFKQRFINFCAHFGYASPHPFPADGDALGDPAPPDAPAGGGSLSPPPPPKVVPGLVAAEPAPRNPVGPIVDGDDATSTNASSSDVSSSTSAIVNNDSSDGVHSVTVID